MKSATESKVETMNKNKLIITAPHKAEWIEVEPSDPGPGEVLIRTRKTMISTGTELTGYTGDFPPNSQWAKNIRYPWRDAGYSNVGEVAAIGSDVTGYQVGQRVASWGRHAAFNIVPLRRVQAIPDGVTDDQALFWNLGMTTMNGVRLAKIALGEAVILVGAGLLGQLAAQYARLCGALPLIVVDLSDRRLEMAKAAGATHALVGGREALLDEIREITRGRMADVVFEITGSPQVIPSLFRMARPLGRIILLGTPRNKVEVDFNGEVHTLGLQIIGAHVTTQPQVETPFNPWTPARNGELFFDLVLAGKLSVDNLITNRFPWQEAPEAYAMLAEDRTQAMGVVLEGWKDE